MWRLALDRYAALDGEGARRYGGRWNSPGTGVIYAATHVSLALLEQLVHVRASLLPERFRAFAIELPEGATVEHVPLDAPINDARETRRMGDLWAASLRSLALVVPSVVVPGVLDPGEVRTTERNVLLNPRHPAAEHWRFAETSFRLDPRLRPKGRA